MVTMNVTSEIPSLCELLEHRIHFGSRFSFFLRFLFPAGWGGKMLNQKSLIKTQNRPFQHPQQKSRLWLDAVVSSGSKRTIELCDDLE